MTEETMLAIRNALDELPTRERWIEMVAELWPSLEPHQDFVWQLLEARLTKEGFDAEGSAVAARQFVESMGLRLGMQPDRN